jgi:hypothetical protein
VECYASTTRCTTVAAFFPIRNTLIGEGSILGLVVGYNMIVPRDLWYYSHTRREKMLTYHTTTRIRLFLLCGLELKTPLTPMNFIESSNGNKLCQPLMRRDLSPVVDTRYYSREPTLYDIECMHSESTSCV